MLQRHHRKVPCLHRRPHHPIHLQRIQIAPLELLFRALDTLAFQQRHGAQEECQVGAREDGLVRQYARRDGRRFRGQVDARERFGVPERCCGPEDEAAIGAHAESSGVVVGWYAFDGVLGESIAGCKEDLESG